MRGLASARISLCPCIPVLPWYFLRALQILQEETETEIMRLEQENANLRDLICRLGTTGGHDTGRLNGRHGAEVAPTGDRKRPADAMVDDDRTAASGGGSKGCKASRDGSEKVAIAAPDLTTCKPAKSQTQICRGPPRPRRFALAVAVLASAKVCISPVFPPAPGTWNCLRRSESVDPRRIQTRTAATRTQTRIHRARPGRTRAARRRLRAH